MSGGGGDKVRLGVGSLSHLPERLTRVDSAQAWKD